MKKEKKTVFTLCLDGYMEDLCSVTFPLMRLWANKIDAEFFVINTRKFPDFLPVYEKMQIYTLGKEMENDWNIFVDCDTLIHPDMIDITQHYQKDTVGHHGNDLASIRWRYNEYMKRDGRHIGSCNWFAIASSWCLDFWHPLDYMTQDEAAKNIFPVLREKIEKNIEPVRLIDDYVMSLNIARYGLKYKNVRDVMESCGQPSNNFLVHDYGMPEEQKLAELKKVIKKWGLLNIA